MVGKIIKGSSSGQCAGYCLNHDNAEILCWQGLDIDFIQAETLASSEGRERLTLAREMAMNISRSFDEQASLNPAVDKPVGHIPLCFMKADAPLLDNERTRRIAEEYLRLMESSDTQYMVVRHDNSKGNPHVHIFFNRVDNNGRCLSAWPDFRRNAEVCRKLTVKYGLNMAKNRSNTIVTTFTDVNVCGIRSATQSMRLCRVAGIGIRSAEPFCSRISRWNWSAAKTARFRE